MDKLQKNRRYLIEKIDSIEKLYALRYVNVHLFDEVAHTLPDGIYLTHLQQQGKIIRLVGKTKSTTHVSNYMSHLNQSNWFSSANLNSVSVSTQKTGHLRDFDLQVVQQIQTLINPLVLGQP